MISDRSVTRASIHFLSHLFRLAIDSLPSTPYHQLQPIPPNISNDTSHSRTKEYLKVSKELSDIVQRFFFLYKPHNNLHYFRIHNLLSLQSYSFLPLRFIFYTIQLSIPAMFSNEFNDRPLMGPSGGIPKPRSLLSSFMFPRSENEDERSRSQQPLSLQSHLLPKSLLGDEVTGRTASDKTSAQNSSLLPPPFRTWSIASDDHKILPKVPAHYPPFDPNCTSIITDAPPSIVIVRISECLRRRSIAVEYDDESITAQCMTVDRVHFLIQLYRAPTAPRNETSNTTLAPPHDAVIVEVRKISGGGMSFHMACYNILKAAKGVDTGDDERPSHRRNGMEFRPRSIAKRKHPVSLVSSSRSMKRRKLPLLSEKDNLLSSQSSDRLAITEQTFEAALNLLQKDRLECQQLGMERLVNLTNKESVGSIISLHASRRLLLQGQEHSNESIESSGRWKLIDCLVHPGAEEALERFPGGEDAAISMPRSKETKNDRMVRSFLESPALTAVTPVSKMHSNDRQRNSFASSLARGASLLKKRSVRKLGDGDINTSSTMSEEELKHEAKLRSMAMRVFCNALENLSERKELARHLHSSITDTPVNSKPNRQPSRWVEPAFLLSLVQDLQGAGRPPSVSETSYKLSSVHEAALAARCLRLLAGYKSDDSHDDNDNEDEAASNKPNSQYMAEQEVVRDFLRSEAVLKRLEYARSCGRANHAILQYEADLTYYKLTEEDRSC